MNIGIVVNNLVIIFIMIMVGLISGRTHIISEKAAGDFTSFLMKVALPCTIFGSMIREYDGTLIRDSIIIFILGLVFFGGFMLIILQVSKLFRIDEARRYVWTVSVSLSNIGFMGFPLILALFGEEGLFLASIMNLAYNIVAWSLGVKVVCMNTKEKGSTDWKKIIFTNNNYAVVLGLFFFLTQLPVPQTVLTVVNHFGGITTPLSMFLIGLTLADGKLSEVFKDKDVFSCSFMRLIVMPLIFAAIMHLLPIPKDSNLVAIVIVIMAMPCPSASMMMAQQYGSDSTLAARAIFLSSLCCIVTIPLMMLLI